MQVQFKGSTVRALQTAVGQIKTSELTQETKLSDSMPDIGRVLTSWGQIVLRSKEWNRGDVAASGALMVYTLYVPEDGTEVRSVESYIPFRMQWDVDEDAREGAIRIIPILRFLDSRGISARKIMIRADIAAMAQAYSPETEEVYKPDEVPADVELLERTYPVRLPKEAGERTFLLDEELSVPNGNPPIEKLLALMLRPEITDKKVMGTKVVFKGNGNLHILYRCAEGKVRSADFELPFSQFADMDSDFGADAQADVRLAVTSLEADVMEQGLLRLKAGLVGQYLVDERELLAVVQDAYSPQREVEPQFDDLELPSVLDDRRETVDAEQMLNAQGAQVIDAQLLPDFPRQRRSGQGIELELPAVFQVLYNADDGSLQAANVRWEGRIAVPADENTELTAFAEPVGKVSTISGSDGVNLNARMQLQLRSTAETDIPMVTGLELGEVRERDPARPSLVLCRAEDEELWSIAKRCGSTVSAIKAANQLDAEPVFSQMLLIPVS